MKAIVRRRMPHMTSSYYQDNKDNIKDYQMSWYNYVLGINVTSWVLVDFCPKTIRILIIKDQYKEKNHIIYHTNQGTLRE